MQQRVDKATVYVLLLFRLVAFSVFLYCALCYLTERNTIANTHIQPYEVAKMKCNKSRRHATVWVNYKGESHAVSINNTLCGKLSVGGTISLYYNKTFDYHFIKGNTKFIYVLGFFLFFCFTFTFKYLAKLEEKLRGVPNQKQ